MSRLRQGIKMQYIYAKPGFVVFWSIVLALVIAQYLGFLYMLPRTSGGSVEPTSLANLLVMTVVTFMGIGTGIQCWETLPYALNLGYIRREFWLSFVVFNYLYALVLAAMLMGLRLLEWTLHARLGLEHQLNEAGAWQVFSYLMLDFAVFAVTAAGVFLAVMLGYRYGWKSFLFLGTGVFVASSIMKLLPALGQALAAALKHLFLVFFGSGTLWSLIGGMLISTVVCYGLAYPLVRGSQVKN